MGINDLGEKLFGSIEHLPKPGGFIVDPKKINMPLEKETSVIKLFCAGCETYIEVGDKGIKELTKNSEIKLPPDLTGYYFESDGCFLCSDDKKEKKIKLKKIVNS